MRISGEVARFLVSPVLIIIGTRNAQNRPEIGRGVGARILDDAETVEIVLSGWQWPGTVANLEENGRMAVTFARASDYVSYQLKGRVALRVADAADIGHSGRYMDDILAVLTRLGLTPDLARPWLVNRDAVVATMTIDEIYVQTPGPKAGTAAGAAP